MIGGFKLSNTERLPLPSGLAVEIGQKQPLDLNCVAVLSL